MFGEMSGRYLQEKGKVQHTLHTFVAYVFIPTNVRETAQHVLYDYVIVDLSIL